MVHEEPTGLIPFLDLTAQYRALRPELESAVRRVFERGQFILGAEVEALEREVASACAAAHAVGVASGTDALELSLRALGIGPGDEVLVPVYTFFATAGAVIAAGATPVFVDIASDTYCLDPSLLSRHLTRKTRAIIPVHLYGHPCDMDAIGRFARAHRLKVVEDCAQAIGASYRGKPVGSFGDAAAFSFYPTKNLGGAGDGGMVVTKDRRVAERVRLLRAHGSRTRYRHEILGTNSRLDELQAAVLRVKLRHLDRWNAARRRLAQRYTRHLRQAKLAGVTLPAERAQSRHVYHLYCVELPARDRVAAALGRAGITTQVCYPSTLADQPALRGLVRGRAAYPVAQAAAARILALPLYPELPLRVLDTVVSRLVGAAGH